MLKTPKVEEREKREEKKKFEKIFGTLFPIW